LKLVQVPGVGLDRIDRSALPDGVSLANVHGHETGIAEYVIGAMLALTRDFSRLDTALRAGEWRSQWSVGVAPPPAWSELAGKTLGILGYGRIGQAVARRARAFDMNISAIRRDVGRSTDDEPAFLGGPDSIGEVLGGSDYVLISMPATADTIGSIDRRQLALMKSTAFLINGRGRRSSMRMRSTRPWRGVRSRVPRLMCGIDIPASQAVQPRPRAPSTNCRMC